MRASTSLPAHDGFTLNYLVSYNDKRNEANGEENRDGSKVTIARGTAAPKAPPTIPKINALARAPEAQFHRDDAVSRRGFRCCSAATRWAGPRSGNNNAYCQDNEISWFHWDQADRDLLEFTRQRN